MTLNLTDGELKCLAAAFQCLKSELVLEVDFAKLGEKLGLKNAASAKARWCPLKKKLLTAGLSDEVQDETKPCDATSTSRKRKGALGDDDAMPGPKKRGRKPKTTVKAEDIEDVKTEEMVKEAGVETMKEEGVEDDHTDNNMGLKEENNAEG
ncbi:hypothetical protein LTR66_007646 [Elasticomyces elasticus]|nr:hypothetical protein LTR66_007646 [Elasticomyces elasticus]KAK4987873.1 hypothetical protein LTR50_004325 [Elasticomyces elasticus]